MISIGGLSAADWQVSYLDHLLLLMMVLVSMMLLGAGQSPWFTSWLFLALWFSLLLLLFLVKMMRSWSPNLMELVFVSSVMLPGEGVWRTVWIIDPIVESLDVFLVSRFFQVLDVLFEGLSFGISLRLMS